MVTSEPTDDCFCFPVPENLQTRCGNATEPGSRWEYNPECPEHGRSDPETPQANHTAVTTSAEGHGAASDALSGQKPAFPSMWWSPSEEQWFADIPGEGLMAFGALGSLADGVPKDAQRLVSVGPLLELVAELATRQAECVRDDADDAAFAYGYAVRLLASLLPESPTREGK